MHIEHSYIKKKKVNLKKKRVRRKGLPSTSVRETDRQTRMEEQLMVPAGFKVGSEEELDPRHRGGPALLATAVRENLFWGDTLSRVLEEGRERTRQVFEGQHLSRGTVNAKAHGKPESHDSRTMWSPV